ncbi:MAG: heavy-metal-associated domain-containing protein [Clostridia bacterium]|nr:heavy-metal-associated domain-containing protein [Clostridia bacterium]
MLHKISVPDMHCNKCVERINKALTETGISYEVSLDSKTVTVDGCEHCLKTALSELEDLGFTPEVI